MYICTHTGIFSILQKLCCLGLRRDFGIHVSSLVAIYWGAVYVLWGGTFNVRGRVLEMAVYMCTCAYSLVVDKVYLMLLCYMRLHVHILCFTSSHNCYMSNSGYMLCYICLHLW